MHPEKTNLNDDALFAGMSHQIYTLMTGLTGMLELLDATALSPSQRGFNNVARASAEDLVSLIDNLLDLSKINTGKLLLQQQPFDLLHEIHAVRSAFSIKAKDKAIELRVHMAPEVARLVLGDAARVRQVVTSLLDSAIESNSSCTLRIDIGEIGQQNDRRHLQICVDGVGNEAEQADAMHRPCDVKHLQIALCRKLVELMGGEVGVERSLGQGNKTWITLNIPPASCLLRDMRVLIVDDRATERHLLEEHLRQHAMRADGFAAAAQALSALANAACTQDPYRVVILDHDMAGIDGETLGAAIKADSAYRDTVLVLMSASTPTDDVNRFAEAGFSAFLSKPAQPRIVLDTLAMLCMPLQPKQATRFVVNGMLHFSPAVQDNACHSPADHRILVVDDNAVNRQIATCMLEKLGYQADTAIDGLAAVDMHARQRYDLILMDCCMPVLDGYQAAARIRVLEAGQSRTPIIGWTSTAQQGGAEDCIAADMDDLLPKPIRPQALQQMLAQWLRPAAATPTAVIAEDARDDLQAMLDMFGTSFPELAALYQNDMPKRLALLQEAGMAGDASQVAKVAHTLCGSCASMGATQLATLCRDMEIRYKTAALSDDFVSEVEAICTEYARIDAKLLVMMGTVSGSVDS